MDLDPVVYATVQHNNQRFIFLMNRRRRDAAACRVSSAFQTLAAW